VTLRPALQLAGLAALVLAAGAAVRVAAPVSAPTAGYSSGPAGSLGAAGTRDTLRVRLADGRTGARPARTMLGSLVVGYFSARGLPPMQGAFTVTDTGLVFHSADGRFMRTLPLVGPVRESAEGRWRASAVSLAYVDEALGRDMYLFRVDGGVFETDAPGALMDVAAHPSWLDSLGSREWTVERALVNDHDRYAVRGLLAALAASPNADSL
jgi:hypothetical protein